MELNEEQTRRLSELVSLARVGASFLRKGESTWDHPAIAPFKPLVKKELHHESQEKPGGVS